MNTTSSPWRPLKNGLKSVSNSSKILNKNVNSTSSPLEFPSNRLKSFKASNGVAPSYQFVLGFDWKHSMFNYYWFLSVFKQKLLSDWFLNVELALPTMLASCAGLKRPWRVRWEPRNSWSWMGGCRWWRFPQWRRSRRRCSNCTTRRGRGWTWICYRPAPAMECKVMCRWGRARIFTSPILTDRAPS